MHYLVILILVNGALTLFSTLCLYIIYQASVFCKVHVKKDKENIYNQMSELQGVFTSDSTATPLHACGGRV